jgi:hypothetical protein
MIKLNKSEQYEKILQRVLNSTYKKLASTSQYEEKETLIMKAEAQIIAIILN